MLSDLKITTDVCYSAVIDSNLQRLNQNMAQNRIEIEIAILVTRTFDFY